MLQKRFFWNCGFPSFMQNLSKKLHTKSSSWQCLTYPHQLSVDISQYISNTCINDAGKKRVRWHNTRQFYEKSWSLISLTCKSRMEHTPPWVQTLLSPLLVALVHQGMDEPKHIPMQRTACQSENTTWEDIPVLVESLYKLFLHVTCTQWSF